MCIAIKAKTLLDWVYLPPSPHLVKISQKYPVNRRNHPIQKTAHEKLRPVGGLGRWEGLPCYKGNARTNPHHSA